MRSPKQGLISSMHRYPLGHWAVHLAESELGYFYPHVYVYIKDFVLNLKFAKYVFDFFWDTVQELLSNICDSIRFAYRGSCIFHLR